MNGPYARLYLELVDDEKFAAIYDDDHHFAAWCRLLMIAEPAWPASAHLPATVRRASVRALSDAGLIDLQPGGRYRIHGLDAERERRHQQAQSASNARWNARSNARASDVRMPNRTEPNLTEPNRGASITDDDGRADLEAFLLVCHRAPTQRQRAFLDAYQDTFDETGPERAERIILGHPDDPIGALKADLEDFRKERLAAAVAAEHKPRPPRRSGGGLTGVNAELARMFLAQEAESPV